MGKARAKLRENRSANKKPRAAKNKQVTSAQLKKEAAPKKEDALKSTQSLPEKEAKATHDDPFVEMAKGWILAKHEDGRVVAHEKLPPGASKVPHLSSNHSKDKQKPTSFALRVRIEGRMERKCGPFSTDPEDTSFKNAKDIAKLSDAVTRARSDVPKKDKRFLFPRKGEKAIEPRDDDKYIVKRVRYRAFCAAL